MEVVGQGSQPCIRTQARKMSQLPSSAWEKDKDLETAVEEFKVKRRTWPMFWGLSYRAIGVVYGDLGTSPLYTYPTVFASRPSRLAIYGSCSLILWILMLQLVVKYICITLYADDNTEGGTFAVYSLLCRHIGITPFGKEEASDTGLSRYSSRDDRGKKPSAGARLAIRIRTHSSLQSMLLLLVLLGTSMLLGDGVLTCAIEVLSAVSGLELRTSISQGVIVAITCIVLFLLFLIQWLGTSRIGALFSPILCAWFAVNAALGLYNIVKFEPGIFRAFNPAYGIRYLVNEGRPAWISLGGIILCVTGAEAMFTDMGHFSRPAIQFTTLAIVMPSCMLTYLGEAAYLIQFPDAFANPYFAAIPEKLFWPVFVIATLSSVVAAQSLITATFSIVRQSAALNCFPPLKVVQTSKSISGQVYLPAVNWALMVGSIGVVAAFQTTASVGNAFGVAFISVMIVTTLLVGLVQLLVWELHPLLPALFLAVFLLLEGIPASALFYKVPHGAWFPIALGVIIMAFSYLWHYGCSQRLAYSLAHTRQLSSLLRPDPNANSSDLVLVEKERSVGRVPGLALYFSDNLRGLPESFSHLISKMPAVHRAVIFITIRQVPLPSTTLEERFLIRPLQLPGFFRVVARYGYQDLVDQGPEFIEDLTARIAALVRYNAMTGGNLGPMADSAAELPGTGSLLGAVAASEQPGTLRSSGRPSELSDSAVDIGASSDVGAAVAVLAGGNESARQSDIQLEAAAASSRRQSSGGESAEGEALLRSQQEPEADAASHVLRARADGVVYVLSKSTLRARAGTGLARRFALETLYPLLLNLSRSPTASWRIPIADAVEVGVIHEA